MKKSHIALIAVGGVVVAVVLAFTVFGSQQVTRIYPIDGVASAQCGNARVKLIYDDRDEIVLRTARRNLLASMVRITDDTPLGRLVEFGYFDDADPRVLIYWLIPQGGNDELDFEVHTSSIEQMTVAGGATLTTDTLETDTFELFALSERPIVLKGVDVDELSIQMQAADVTAEGRAGVLHLMNSSDSGEFIGDNFTASNHKPY